MKLTFALEKVSRFLRWWLWELVTVIQQMLPHSAHLWRRNLTAYISRNRISIVEAHSANTPLLEMAGQDMLAGTELPLPEHLAVVLERGHRIRIVLDPEYAFLRSFRLPLAALAHLRSALELHIPKLLPMDAALLRTDHSMLEVNPQSATIDVELAAIKCSDIEPIEKALRHWGLQPTAVHLGRPNDPQPRFSLGNSDSNTGRWALSRADACLAAAAATLTMAALVTYAVQSYRAQRSLEEALIQSGPEAASVLQQRQHLSSRVETLTVLSAAERAPTAAAVLAEVTTHIGHDTWLTALDLKGHELRLIGLSPNPASVVSQLASSTLLSEVELRSSMSVGAASLHDRFEITAQVATGT
jgi:hypothetical protein